MTIAMFVFYSIKLGDYDWNALKYRRQEEGENKNTDVKIQICTGRRGERSSKCNNVLPVYAQVLIRYLLELENPKAEKIRTT